MVAITILCALSAGASGLLSWRNWRRTRRREEEQTIGTLQWVPYWALGGLFLSAVFFVAIVLTGGLAVGLSATCVS
jgi:TRAP-type C4-dicarboxylate transport system permease small subunit